MSKRLVAQISLALVVLIFILVLGLMGRGVEVLGYSLIQILVTIQMIAGGVGLLYKSDNNRKSSYILFGVAIFNIVFMMVS